jgi:hypothetical protein
VKKKMRRRTTSSTGYLDQVSKPWDYETELLSAIDARQKLQTAIANEKQKNDTAVLDFTTGIIREVSASDTVNVDSISQKNETARVAAERGKQRVDALDSILARVNARIDQLKTNDPNSANAALTKKIDSLDKSLSDKDDKRKDVEVQINVLKDELSKLPKTATKKAAS